MLAEGGPKVVGKASATARHLPSRRRQLLARDTPLSAVRSCCGQRRCVAVKVQREERAINLLVDPRRLPVEPRLLRVLLLEVEELREREGAQRKVAGLVEDEPAALLSCVPNTRS